MTKSIPFVVSVVTLVGGGTPSWADSHLWTFNEVFSNSDGTIQFFEMHCPAGADFETSVNGKELRSQATGGNFTISGLSLSKTGDKFLLFATADFAALPGAPTPDVIIPAAGVPFIGIGETETLLYCVLCDYDQFHFTAGALPTDGITSLNRDLSTGINSPTNFAGDAGSIDVGDPVPSVSAWGLAALALLVVAAGSAVLARRRVSPGAHPA